MEITGLSKDNIEKISKIKDEEQWILDFRLKSFALFNKLDMPDFGPKFDLDFDKVIYYSIALNIPDSCDDNILRKPYPNPQKSISSSVIKVSFDDGSFFELTPNGSLNIQVVDRNTCLIIESDFNNEHVKYKEGKKCDKAFMICE